MSIARTADLAGYSIAEVKRPTALHTAKAGSVVGGNRALTAPQVPMSVALVDYGPSVGGKLPFVLSQVPHSKLSAYCDAHRRGLGRQPA